MTTNNQSKMAARYGEPDASALLACNDIIDQLLDHRSLRAVTTEPRLKEQSRLLSRAAQSASTSSKLQVWSEQSTRYWSNPAASLRL